MRRGLGMVLMVMAAVIVVLGVALSAQILGHTDWWQGVVLVAVVLGVGYLLLRTGRRLRA